jgi:DNA polymerase-3 subunit epsilon
MRLAEETRIINSVNPAHRIRLEGSKDIQRLVQIINEAADRIESLQQNVNLKVSQAKAETENEKNILAAILSDLPEGVLICNEEGQIILYNIQAKLFLTVTDSAPKDNRTEAAPTERFVGLGRSIYGVIDRNLIDHAIDEITEKLRRQEADAAAYFVIIGSDGKLLRTEAVPILNHQRQFTGFILIFYDITQQLESESRVDLLLQSLTTRLRASVASIRAAVESILEYPDMSAAQRLQFNHIIHREALALGGVLDQNTTEYTTQFRTQWPLVEMQAQDLLDVIRRRAEGKLDIILTSEDVPNDIWVRVDRYSLILAVLFLLNHLRKMTGNRMYKYVVKKTGGFAHIDLVWQGEPIKIDSLRRWFDQVLVIGQEGLPLTLKEVAGHHEMEIWSATSRKSPHLAYLRLYLRAIDTPQPIQPRSIAILPESRPAFYDFDLFSQAGQRPEVDNRLLSELAYTVFDTETTGLDPQGGDEIISIGAIRIVNGNLLHDEVFDQLIDPCRSIPEESIKIHGIQPQMLEGKPTIKQVLPLFMRFAEDTVLVAHNAAFDMRMLQLKERQTGVTFINPVLDTMLLSAAVHPAHNNHNMAVIAKRLGIKIIGRHTALGDARATGEIFLKLLPLLEKQGIRTLKEAREASQKTLYARLKY